MSFLRFSLLLLISVSEVWMPSKSFSYDGKSDQLVTCPLSAEDSCSVILTMREMSAMSFFWIPEISVPLA